MYDDSIVSHRFNSHEVLYNKQNIYYAIYVRATETRTTSSKSIKRTTARTKRTKPTTVSQCVSNLVKEHDFEVKIIDLVNSPPSQQSNRSPTYIYIYEDN